MKLKRQTRRLILSVFLDIFAALLIIILAAPACSDRDGGIEPVDPCPKVALSENLVSVFYWGYNGSVDWVANSGTPISGVRSPKWINTREMIAATGTRLDGFNSEGAVIVTTDIQTFEYQSHQFFRYPNVILQLDWDLGTENLLILERVGSGQSRVVLGHLAQDQVAVDEEIANPDWHPVSVDFHPTAESVFIGGIDPTSGIPGLYCFYRQNGGFSDSLIFNALDFIPRSSGIAIDIGGSLFFEKSRFDGGSSIVQIDLTSLPDDGTVILERDWPFISIEAHPHEAGTLVVSYRFPGDAHNPPEDVVEIVQPPYTSSTKVDTRTHEQSCRFPTNGEVAWDPTGSHLAFPGGAVAAEGTNYIQKLWIAMNARD